MKTEDKTNLNGPISIATGMGLIALDVIINEDTKFCYKICSGGSCGNVLAILSYLGWKSYPIAHIRPDSAAELIIKDMNKLGIDTSYILQDEKGRTPVIIESIKKTRNGHPKHRFSSSCPDCGSYLPRFKAISKKEVSDIVNKLPGSHVFYFDRISASSIEIAEAHKIKGSLIFFEPNGIKDEELFLECSKLADIVKFSNQMMGRSREIISKINPPMLIETLGANGLRLRYNKNGNVTSWKTMHAFAINQMRDAAGAGDWCSAGIIHKLGKFGKESFENSQERDMDRAVKFGQALAAINCKFDGARGAMYGLSEGDLSSSIYAILNEKDEDMFMNVKLNEVIVDSMVRICPECQQKLVFKI
jgi:fructokinase